MVYETFSQGRQLARIYIATFQGMLHDGLVTRNSLAA